jgi:hypothetical protein
LRCHFFVSLNASCDNKALCKNYLMKALWACALRPLYESPLGLSGPLRGSLGLSAASCGSLGLSGRSLEAFWKVSGVFWQLSGALWGSLRSLGLSGALWCSLELSGALWVSLGLSGLSGALCGSPGALWGSLGLSGALRGLSGALWGSLGFSGALWGSLRLSGHFLRQQHFLWQQRAANTTGPRTKRGYIRRRADI